MGFEVGGQSQISRFCWSWANFYMGLGYKKQWYYKIKSSICFFQSCSNSKHISIQSLLLRSHQKRNPEIQLFIEYVDAEQSLTLTFNSVRKEKHQKYHKKFQECNHRKKVNKGFTKPSYAYETQRLFCSQSRKSVSTALHHPHHSCMKLVYSPCESAPTRKNPHCKIPSKIN